MGEVFAGRYELLDPVADGGMGAIWRALDRTTGQVLAAKVLRQSDAGSLLRFVREQSMRIDHAHVVTPLSWAGLDDRVLFTMPLVRGGSVADLLRGRGALSAYWTAVLIDQLLAALEAVHGAGIIHRDVKPGNLLLDPFPAPGLDRPHLRLTDFGIAAPIDQPRMTRAATAIGTPGYMPPEQWIGADPEPSADLYAVGWVALEMLTGQRPPAVQEPVTPADDLSPLRTGETSRDRLIDVIERAIAADPGARPASATRMRAELAATGVLDVPAGDADPLVVPDRFDGIELSTLADVPSGPTMAPGGTAIAGRAPTMAFTPTPVPAPTPTAPQGRRSATPGLILVLLGLAGLALAIWLLVG